MLDRFHKGIITLWEGTKRVANSIKNQVSAFTANTIKAVKSHKKDFRRIKTFLVKGFLYALSPLFLAIVLAVVLFSKLSRYISKWISYCITALRAILVFIGDRRTIDEDEIDETIEFTGFTYDPYQDIFYSTMEPWQRKFGYCRLYDEAAAPLGMVIDCEPIYFEYDKRKWLIELWKGQYGLTTGFEIGVYTTEGPNLDIPGIFNGTFYNSVSDEERLQMSYIAKKNGKLLFARTDLHWWLTGFKLGEFSEPSELTMKVKITLKDDTMCDAFIEGLNNAGYLNREITRLGQTVIFKFNKPKTKKPITRKKLTDGIIQKKNKYLCKKFEDITGPCNTVEEKLKVIQEKAPRLYKKIIKIGKTPKLYKKLKEINNLFN